MTTSNGAPLKLQFARERATHRRMAHRYAIGYGLIFGMIFGLTFCVPAAVFWDMMRGESPTPIEDIIKKKCDDMIMHARSINLTRSKTGYFQDLPLQPSVLRCIENGQTPRELLPPVIDVYLIVPNHQ